MTRYVPVSPRPFWRTRTVAEDREGLDRHFAEISGEEIPTRGPSVRVSTALHNAAQRAGMTAEAYLDAVREGREFCRNGHWVNSSEMGDGSSCKACKAAQHRACAARKKARRETAATSERLEP